MLSGLEYRGKIVATKEKHSSRISVAQTTGGVLFNRNYMGISRLPVVLAHLEASALRLLVGNTLITGNFTHWVIIMA
jgi:hypothetical protein